MSDDLFPNIYQKYTDQNKVLWQIYHKQSIHDYTDLTNSVIYCGLPTDK